LRNSRVGEININKHGSIMEIVQYNKHTDITVKFSERGNLVHTTYGNFKSGSVKNPYDKTICGVGYLGEGVHRVWINGKATIQYVTWHSMMKRCYNSRLHLRQPSYKNCKVDERWHNFQTFTEWYNRNFYEIDGESMSLDKDILIKSNKVYSPETAIFSPQRINNLFLKRDSGRGKLPIGVRFEKITGKYSTCCAIGKGNSIHLGNFNSPEEAFQVYKSFKENYIKQVANEYKDRIPTLLYNALMYYIVEIDD
jgi:hypothetical protein